MSDLNETGFMILGAEAGNDDENILVGGDEELDTQPKKKSADGDDWNMEEDLEEGLE